MQNGVFWDVTPCGSCKNRRFGGTKRLLHQDARCEEIPSILVTLIKESLSSSETSVLIRHHSAYPSIYLTDQIN
jgi:hypothetical protein